MKCIFLKTKSIAIFIFAMCLNLCVLAQTATVTGKVVDKDGVPVSNVVIFEGGKKVGTTTALGLFKITVDQNATISFSNGGFETKIEKLNGRAIVDVALVNKANSTSGEITVIGYGSVRKKDLTGSIVSVSAKDFQQGQVSSPQQLIAGKVAGVQITSGGGAPGSGSTIRIRGGASLSSTNEPLIVVDGIPLDLGGISGSANALSLINPNDIATFTVLKDAASAAIYGSRASNGVILITTKKGRSGKPQFNFSTILSVSTVTKTADVLSASEFKNIVNTSTSNYNNAGLRALLSNGSTDWQKEIFQTAITTDNNFNVTGAYKKLPYRVSLGYLNQQGILRTDNLQRTTVALNLSPKFLKNALKVDFNIKGGFNKARFANGGAIGAAAAFDPSKPVFTGNKNYGGYSQWLSSGTNTGLTGLAPLNPIGLLEQREDESNVSRYITSLQLDYTLPWVKGLKAVLNVGFDASIGKGTIIQNDSAAASYRRFNDSTGVLRSGVNNEYYARKFNPTGEFYVNYVTDLKKINSKIDVTVGTSYQAFKTNIDNFADYSYGKVMRPNSKPNFLNDEQENRLISFYSRLIYTLNNKYVFTGTLRADGSSRIAPKNRWGYFPTIAAAWRVNEEDFLKNSKVVSDLKFRLSYGLTGQQEGISNYSYLPNYALGNNTAQYELGNTFVNMFRPIAYNDALKWEQTASTNAAIDFGLFENRITGSLDFYVKNTTDLLNEVDIPLGSNFTNRIVTNIGSMKNRGVEFTINSDIVKRNDLNVNLGFNISYNKNEITKLTLNENPGYLGVPTGGISGGTGQNVQIHRVGFARSSFLVYKQIYDANGKPIDNLFEDLNRDGTINDEDLYVYQQPDPKVFLGATANVNYKKWNGGFVIRGNFGNYAYNNVNSNTGTYRSIFNPLGFLANGSRDLLKSGFNGDGDKYLRSDYYLSNASFLRMDNLNFGYNAGKVFNGKANMRLSLNVQNVFTITKYEGVDPEINGGIDNNFYPRPRVFALGVNLGF